DQAARDLHHKKRDAEEGENFTAEKRRNNQKHKPVGRDFTGQYFLSGLRIIPGEAEKNRSVAERIYNREQRCKRDTEGLDEVDGAEFHSIYFEMKNSSSFGTRIIETLAWNKVKPGVQSNRLHRATRSSLPLLQASAQSLRRARYRRSRQCSV